MPSRCLGIRFNIKGSNDVGEGPTKLVQMKKMSCVIASFDFLVNLLSINFRTFRTFLFRLTAFAEDQRRRLGYAEEIVILKTR